MFYVTLYAYCEHFFLLDFNIGISACTLPVYIFFVFLTDAAYGLIHRKSQIFSFSSNNSLLQFIAEVIVFLKPW